ncbi:sulfur oxidation c-type cytochrome SoxX [Rhodosalinus halophilus]|uniref:Sulfur oxidation c-type cytochrome SoxX n=1 Tax=Rhodosalinus halophilus TaxID=2259333 RepID=A0A365U3W6_9RHOB|nr:sulfur oxidation c-type cytochrome SoxX [Rhodosalinus halophilus]RBI82775.1 sulfur oxidation c-type cytochrome SoxX [Rhodosalinus halophilus]
MKRTGTMLAGALIAMSAAAQAETVVDPQEVVFGEYGEVTEPLTSTPGDPARGEEIMVTKSAGNCISCHMVSALDYAPFHGEVGPPLDGVADRWGEAELRGILVDAKKTYQGTIMPSYYKTTGYVRPGVAFTSKPAEEPLPPLLSAQDIEDVVAFLSTLHWED